MKTDEQLLSDFISAIHQNSVIFGQIGNGYPSSFYRVYVLPRYDAKRWWRVESHAFEVKLPKFDPIKDQVKICSRHDVLSVLGNPKSLANFTCMPGRPALVEVFKRIRELNEGT